jgi:hypothetical protein
MVHRRSTGTGVSVFGNQGALFGNAMTWWDHDTGSVWSQPLGEAILGPRKGEKLALLPSTLTTWDAWRGAHPDTLALDVRGGRSGFDLSRMAIVIDLGTETVAYSIPRLREVGVVNDVIAGLEVAVVIDPDEPNRWVAFSRKLDNEVVVLGIGPDGLYDTVTGTTFDSFLGLGGTGPLADQDLSRLPAFTTFPEDYPTFFPGQRFWNG